MFTVQLRILGPIQCQRDGQRIELKIGKMQALLAYLAVTRQPQAREHLLDLLWPESAPEAARKNLRNSLWRLRQQIGDDVLCAQGDDLSLASHVWSDVAAFEVALDEMQLTPGAAAQPAISHSTLSDPLALWRGPLLDGLNLTDAPDFEIWLQSERTRLGERYLAGLRDLLRVQRTEEQWSDVLATTQLALAHDPAQEEMHAARMEAFARNGARNQALRQYHALQTILARELGATPLPSTQTLYAQILAGALEPGSPMQVADALGASPTHRSRSTIRPPFVGRTQERAQLDDALQATRNGECRIVLLTGELGIGKSTLWRQWASALADAVTVLETRCLEATQALPFAPLSTLLTESSYLQLLVNPDGNPHPVPARGSDAGLSSSHSRRTVRAQLRSPVSPIWLTELSRLLPHIRDLRPNLPLAAAVPPNEERRRIFEALVQGVQALSTHQTVLFIDDLHWADQATLEWLAYFVERMQDQPVLLVCAYRPGNASRWLTQNQTRWLRERLAQVVQIGPLTQQEATELVAALDGNVSMVDYLHTQSAGNPYYLTELSRVHPDGMPAALVDLIGARLHGLPQSAQRALQAAAILEPDISFEILCRVHGGSDDETLDALDVLLDADLLVERGDRYEFVHPLVAHIVSDELSRQRRRQLHRGAAAALAAMHPTDLEAIAGPLTRHYAAAGDVTAAALHAERAAAQALQIGAVAEAVHFYRQACALQLTPSRQVALGYALMQEPGGLQVGREMMQQALVLAEATNDHAGIVQAGLALAFNYLSTQEGEQVLHWAQRMLAASQQHVAQGRAQVEVNATIQYLLAAGKFHTAPDITAADPHYAEATRLATAHDLTSDIAIQSWFGWGNLSVQCGDFAAAQRKFQRTRDIAAASGNIYFQVLGANNLAYAALLAGDMATARTAIQQGLDLAETHQLMRPRHYLFSTQGEIALAEGAWDNADHWFQRALDEAMAYDNTTHAANVQAHLGRVALARGDLDRADTFLRAAYAAVPDDSAHHLRIQLALWLADLHRLRGDRQEAQQRLDDALAKLRGSGRGALIAVAQRLQREL